MCPPHFSKVRFRPAGVHTAASKWVCRDTASDDEADASKRFAQSASVVLSDADLTLPVLKEVCQTDAA